MKKLVVILRNDFHSAKVFEVEKYFEEGLVKAKKYNGGLIDLEFGIRNGGGQGGHYKFDKFRILNK